MPFYLHRADLGPGVLSARGFLGDVHVLVLNSRPVLAQQRQESHRRLHERRDRVVAAQARLADARAFLG